MNCGGLSVLTSFLLGSSTGSLVRKHRFITQITTNPMRMKGDTTNAMKYMSSTDSIIQFNSIQPNSFSMTIFSHQKKDPNDFYFQALM